MIDTLRAVETPEGVMLTLRTAGLWPRAIAFLIDAAARWVVYLVLAIVLGQAGQVGSGVLLVTLFAGEWFYPVYFEVTRGATPGKRALGLCVVHDDGTPVTFASSLLRNFLLAVDFFPFAYAGGLVCVMAHPLSRRLGDIAAGTLVVYTASHVRHGGLPQVVPVAPPLRLDAAEQQAVLDFADRSTRFDDARLVELAALLEPVSGAGGEEGVRRVLGWARHIGDVR